MLILIGVNQVIVGGGASRETEVSSGARGEGYAEVGDVEWGEVVWGVCGRVSAPLVVVPVIVDVKVVVLLLLFGSSCVVAGVLLRRFSLAVAVAVVFLLRGGC